MIDGSNEKAFLAGIIHMESRIRTAEKSELPFIVVNELKTIVPFTQAVIFINDKALYTSGVENIGVSSEFHDFLKALYKKLPDEDFFHFSNDNKNLPSQIIGIRQGETFVLFCRDDPFQENEAQILTLLVTCYREARDVVHKKPKKIPFKSLFAVLGLLLLIPVKSVTYSKAEVDRYNPESVRSSISGVIDKILISPNEAVHAGQEIILLDQKQIRSEIEVAQKEKDVSQSEYDEAIQESMNGDNKARGQINILKDKIQEANDKLEYQKSMLERTVIKSKTDGIAMFDDISSLIGHPVSVGEKIMDISDKESNVIKIDVPTSDIVTYEKGASVRFFDNINPTYPHSGKLTYIGYLPTVKADNTLIYVNKAEINAKLRPGIQGTAMIYGKRTPLIMWLLRKPINSVRPWMPF